LEQFNELYNKIRELRKINEEIEKNQKKVEEKELVLNYGQQKANA